MLVKAEVSFPFISLVQRNEQAKHYQLSPSYMHQPFAKARTLTRSGPRCVLGEEPPSRVTNPTSLERRCGLTSNPLHKKNTAGLLCHSPIRHSDNIRPFREHSYSDLIPLSVPGLRNAVPAGCTPQNAPTACAAWLSPRPASSPNLPGCAWPPAGAAQVLEQVVGTGQPASGPRSPALRLRSCILESSLGSEGPSESNESRRERPSAPSARAPTVPNFPLWPGLTRILRDRHLEMGKVRKPSSASPSHTQRWGLADPFLHFSVCYDRCLHMDPPFKTLDLCDFLPLSLLLIYYKTNIHHNVFPLSRLKCVWWTRKQETPSPLQICV